MFLYELNVTGSVFMKVVVSLVVIFIISFLLLLKLVYSGNKQESGENKMGPILIVFVVTILALLPTAAMGLVLFALIGSTNTVNMIFSLNLSMKQLIILAVSFLVYLFTIDSIIEMVVKHILGKGMFYYSAVLLIRIGAFYVIGEVVDLNQKVSLTIAIGVAIIILLIELLYNLREKHKKQND